MPDQLKTSRISGATLGSELPARITELETAISVITGIPLDVIINNPMSEVVAAGLTRIKFQDLAADPAVIGEVARNGSQWKFHDGTAARVLPLVYDNSVQSQYQWIRSTGTETGLSAPSIAANSLGTRNKLTLYLLLRVGLLAGAFVQIRCTYGSLGPVLTISNASFVTAPLTLCPLVIQLWGNGTTQDQVLAAHCYISQSQSNLADPFSSVSPFLSTVVGLSEDSTIARALQINVLFSAGNIDNQCDCLGGLLTFEG